LHWISRIIFKAKGLDMNMMVKLKNFVKDESGQTTTEYILILAVIVTIFMQFRKKLIGILNKIFGELETSTDGIIEDVD
jgi:Flp pilus assembly pilin Flp